MTIIIFISYPLLPAFVYENGKDGSPFSDDIKIHQDTSSIIKVIRPEVTLAYRGWSLGCSERISNVGDLQGGPSRTYSYITRIHSYFTKCYKTLKHPPLNFFAHWDLSQGIPGPCRYIALIETLPAMRWGQKGQGCLISFNALIHFLPPSGERVRI